MLIYMFLLGVAMIAKQHLSGDEKNRKKKRKEKPVQIQPWLLRTYLAAKSSTRPPATGTSSRVLGPPPDPGSCTMSWIQDDDQTAVGSWLLAVEGG